MRGLPANVLWVILRVLPDNSYWVKTISVGTIFYLLLQQQMGAISTLMLSEVLPLYKINTCAKSFCLVLLLVVYYRI